MQITWQKHIKLVVICLVSIQHNPAYSETCADSHAVILFLRDSFPATVKINSLIPNILIQEVQLKQACLTTQNFQNDLIAYFPDFQECRGVSGDNVAQLNRLLGQAKAFELLSRTREIVANLQYGSGLVYRIGNPLGAGSLLQEDGSLSDCPIQKELIFSSGFEVAFDS